MVARKVQESEALEELGWQGQKAGALVKIDLRSTGTQAPPSWGQPGPFSSLKASLTTLRIGESKGKFMSLSSFSEFEGTLLSLEKPSMHTLPENGMGATFRGISQSLHPSSRSPRSPSKWVSMYA